MGQNNEHHFIIKELAGESKGQIECLEESTKIYIISSDQFKKK